MKFLIVLALFAAIAYALPVEEIGQNQEVVEEMVALADSLEAVRSDNDEHDVARPKRQFGAQSRFGSGRDSASNLLSKLGTGNSQNKFGPLGGFNANFQTRFGPGGDSALNILSGLGTNDGNSQSRFGGLGGFGGFGGNSKSGFGSGGLSGFGTSGLNSQSRFGSGGNSASNLLGGLGTGNSQSRFGSGGFGGNGGGFGSFGGFGSRGFGK